MYQHRGHDPLQWNGGSGCLNFAMLRLVVLRRDSRIPRSPELPAMFCTKLLWVHVKSWWPHIHNPPFKAWVAVSGWNPAHQWGVHPFLEKGILSSQPRLGGWGATLFVAGLASINVAGSHEFHEDTFKDICSWSKWPWSVFLKMKDFYGMFFWGLSCLNSC